MEQEFIQRVQTRAYFLGQNNNCRDEAYNWEQALAIEYRQVEIRSLNPTCIVCQQRDENSEWRELNCGHFMHEICHPDTRAYCPECITNSKVAMEIVDKVEGDEHEYFPNDQPDEFEEQS